MCPWIGAGTDSNVPLHPIDTKCYHLVPEARVNGGTLSVMRIAIPILMVMMFMAPSAAAEGVSPTVLYGQPTDDGLLLSWENLAESPPDAYVLTAYSGSGAVNEARLSGAVNSYLVVDGHRSLAYTVTAVFEGDLATPSNPLPYPYCDTPIRIITQFPFINFIDECWCPTPDGSSTFCSIAP